MKISFLSSDLTLSKILCLINVHVSLYNLGKRDIFFIEMTIWKQTCVASRERYAQNVFFTYTCSKLLVRLNIQTIYIFTNKNVENCAREIVNNAISILVMGFRRNGITVRFQRLLLHRRSRLYERYIARIPRRNLFDLLSICRVRRG